MNEHFKAVPPLEFSRLGYSRKHAIPLNTDRSRRPSRPFTYNNIPKRFPNRIPKSPSRANIKVDEKKEIIHALLQHVPVNSSKKRVNRITRSRSYSNMKMNEKNNILFSNTKVDDFHCNRFRLDEQKHINRRKQVKNARIDLLNQVNMHVSRSSSSLRSGEHSKQRWRSASAPRSRV